MTTILIDKNIMLPMRDGVRLATDVYHLDGEAPAPVLLARTPYDKERTVIGGCCWQRLASTSSRHAKCL